MYTNIHTYIHTYIYIYICIRLEQIKFCQCTIMHAHKNRVLMSLSCRGANISTETLCQAVYKIQIRTNPQCLTSAVPTFNSLFLKAVPCKLVKYWVPMYKLHTLFWESSLHVFLFSLWQTVPFRTISKISTMPKPKENYT